MAKQMKQPRLADMVAASLREDVVSGKLGDGDELPTLDALVDRFSVSPPSIREALRILEHEGLITVRRGNVGGAVVHRPTPGGAAYALGVVLQSRRVRAADLIVALRHFEPICAALCAERDDRITAVVPKLTQILEASERALEDGVEFLEQSRSFHDELRNLCGNETVTLVVGALASLWRVQEIAWSKRKYEYESLDDEHFDSTLKSHRDVVAAIKDGDAGLAAEAMRTHLSTPAPFGQSRKNPVIRATDLRPGDMNS